MGSNIDRERGNRALVMCFCQDHFRGSEMPFKIVLVMAQNWSRREPHTKARIPRIEKQAFLRTLRSVLLPL